MAEELSGQDIRMIRALTMHLPVSRAGLPLESLEEMMRRIAREEIASLAGLGLHRDAQSSPFWGEVLADFSGHTGDGEGPGE